MRKIISVANNKGGVAKGIDLSYSYISSLGSKFSNVVLKYL